MFSGSMVALVTPMKANNAVDFDALSGLLEWHVNSGTKAIVILGTTGESPTIIGVEREQLIKHVVAFLQDKVPVIVGTGTNSTQSSIELTRQAMELGVDGALLVCPYYNRPTQEGACRHFTAIAQAVPIPLILYNHPGRTGFDMQPETVKKLSVLPNIVAIKDATGTVQRLQQMRELECDLTYLGGDDAIVLDFMSQGGAGIISVVANVIPDLFNALCEHVQNHEMEKAVQIDQKISHLYRVLALESNPIPVKWALHKMGRIDAGIRLPLTPLSEAYRADVEHVLRQLHCL